MREHLELGAFQRRTQTNILPIMVIFEGVGICWEFEGSRPAWVKSFDEINTLRIFAALGITLGNPLNIMFR